MIRTLLMSEAGRDDAMMAGGSQNESKTEPWQRLAEGLRRGDRDSFAELVTLADGRLRRLLGRLTAGQHDVDELVQESYLRAWRRRTDFRGESSPMTWLTRIAINIALNWRRGRRPTLPLDLDQHRDRGATTACTEQALLVAYERALAGLNGELRTTFVLHENEGLSYREIAELLECPIGTVMSRLHRARSALLTELKDRLEEMTP